MDSLVKSNRDLIKLKNGYYKYTFHSLYQPSGADHRGNPNDIAHTFKFSMPPMNSMGFSDHYSQALIKISSVCVYNVEGLNQIFLDNTGQTIPSAGTFHVGIPCAHNHQISDLSNQGAVRHNAPTHSGLHVPLTRGKNILAGMEGTEALDGIAEAAQLGASGYIEYSNTYGRQAVGGVATATPADAPINDPVVTKSYSVPYDNVSYTYENKASIFEAGLLCGNPFGSEIDCYITAPYGANRNPKVGLFSQTRDTAASNSTYIHLELEIQLLPNPTSRD